VQRVDNRETADEVGIQFTRAGGEAKSLKESEGRMLSEDGLAAGGPAGEMGVANGRYEAGGELSADKVVMESPDVAVVIDGEGDRVLLSAGVVPVSDGKHVIATLPNPEASPDWTEFFSAVDAARAKGLNVDYVPRGETADLVVIPKPTESDWPAMLGDPPRRERVIADKAWERLGLKLVPASRLERLDFEGRRVGGAVKIVGGNVPKGLPLPAFVRRIGDTELNSFDDLLAWLGSEKGRSEGEIKVSAFADGNDYLFDAAPAAVPAATKPKVSSSLEVGTSTERADNWPAGVDFTSPKEAEIARRAWKELGIKVAPASEAELSLVRRKGLHGGLKLIDFEDRMNLAGPFILTHIFAEGYATGIANFDALSIALEELAAQPATQTIRLEGTAKNGNVFLYSLRRPKASSAGGSSADHSSESAPAGARFPTLDQQRLADAIYKAMDLEVGTIGENELSRVNALGYDGGVLITAAVGQSNGRFQPSDILVGLHVWPTTNLQEVVAVLGRDDLSELNPLKYYVVRKAQKEGSERQEDFVFSGRLTVRPPSAGKRVDESAAMSAPVIDGFTADPDAVRPDSLPHDDPRLALLQQELAQRQMQLARSQLNRRSGGREAAEIELQIGQLQRQIEAYREAIQHQVQAEQEREREGSAPSSIRPGDPHGVDQPEPDTFELRPQRPWPEAPLADRPSAPTSHAMPPYRPQMPGPHAGAAAANPFATTPLPAVASDRYESQPPQPPQVAASGAEPRSAAVPLELRFFYAPDTRPCQDALNELAKFEKQFPDGPPITRINVVNDRAAAAAAGVNLIPTLLIQKDGQEVRRISGRFTAAELLIAVEAAETRPPAVAGPTTPKASLRYDGKTFDYWRDLWRNELSTERRMEAVKALAAFGAAGYGTEAAEAILEVVKQYDWTTVGGGSPLALLKDEAILAFAGKSEGAASIPLDDWLPVLGEAVRSGNKRLGLFAQHVFRRFNSSDAESEQRLLELSRDPQWKSVWPAMLQRLQTNLLSRRMNSPGSPLDEQVEARMVEALGEGPEAASIALFALYPSTPGGMFARGGMGGEVARQPELVYRPELIDLLEKTDGPLAEHIADQVVRALTRLGPKAKPAVPRLLELLMERDVKIARKVLGAIPAVSGSDQELRDYLTATIEKAESPERVKRAEAMLKEFEKRREQEAGAMRMEDGETDGKTEPVSGAEGEPER
jgi:hypothetical protein